MAISQRRLSLEEFLDLPDRKPALEYVDGEVARKVAPKLRHGVLQFRLAQFVNNLAQPSRVALAVPEARATFGGRSVVPDVSVYSWERLPRDGTGELADDVFEPPDIAMEILSPRQSVTQLVRRCVWYVENGVRLAILVDPKDRTVFEFRPDQRMRALRGDDQIDFSPLLTDAQLSVNELFRGLLIG